MSHAVTRLLKNPRTWPSALAVYWLALFVGTHIPTELPLGATNWIDKVLHVFAFTGLAVLLAGSWEIAGRGLRRGGLLLVWLGVAIYGAIDEWTQIPVGRDGSVMDWLADVSGAAMGLLLFVWLRRWFAKGEEGRRDLE